MIPETRPNTEIDSSGICTGCKFHKERINTDWQKRKLELKKIFDGALLYQKNKSCIEPYMVRVILILVYSVGLRLHEALSLKLSDIDLMESVITIHQAKYYKIRLVPFNQQLAGVLRKYFTWRKKNKPYVEDKKCGW